MMTTSRMLVLAAITRPRLAAVIHRLPPERRRGRPWSCSLARRILVVCAALRTNLTIRELAASFAISKSAVHRILSTMTPRLAALGAQRRPDDRRESWVVDGTLIPTRDHRRAARSKNYRWSCNAQILIRRRDLRIVATTAGGPGNRNDPVHYRGSSIEARCKQHGRVLADGGYRGIPELVTPMADVSRQPESARPSLASTSSTSSPRRARDRSSQELADLARSSPSWRASRRYPSGGRLLTQPPTRRITGQPLALRALVPVLVTARLGA